jgi:hypothetical protein
MFGWLRKQPQPEDPRIARIQQHFLLAEGSERQRFATAAAMYALESDIVQKQRKHLSSANEIVFMMTYECFVMWAIKLGIGRSSTFPDAKLILTAIHRHYAKHAWYRSGDFEKIWDKMQVLMPMALKSDASGMICPVAEMILAANQAGFPLDHIDFIDLEFGMHVCSEIGRLATVAKEMERLQ